MGNWWADSNRWKHFVLAVPCAALLTILFVAGLAAGMEFKDKAWGGRWDWYDLLATLLGGVVGQAIQCVGIWAIIQDYTLFGL